MDLFFPGELAIFIQIQNSPENPNTLDLNVRLIRTAPQQNCSWLCDKSRIQYTIVQYLNRQMTEVIYRERGGGLQSDPLET